MVDESHKRDLGLESSGKRYPAELAMYRSALHRTGMHRYDPQADKMVFEKPTEASLRPAWHIVSSAASSPPRRRVPLDELHVLLLSPPVGMRRAAVAVFLTAWMLAQGDCLRVFEGENVFEEGNGILLDAETALKMAEHPERFAFEIETAA